VARVRSALRGIPGVNAEEYDLLFNSELREWTIVKWVDLPEPRNYVPGLGYTVEVVREPFPVYEIDARKRGPASLSDLGWTRPRRDRSRDLRAQPARDVRAGRAGRGRGGVRALLPPAVPQNRRANRRQLRLARGNGAALRRAATGLGPRLHPGRELMTLATME